MLDTSDSESSSSHWVEPVLPGTHPLLLAFHVELPRLTHSSLILPRWLSVLRSGWSLYMGPGRTSLWPEIRAGQQCRCFLVGKFSNSRKFFFFFSPGRLFVVNGSPFPTSSAFHTDLKCPKAWRGGGTTDFLLILPFFSITIKRGYRFKAPELHGFQFDPRIPYFL